jgi:uroporphyrinogen decarboxylase
LPEPTIAAAPGAAPGAVFESDFLRACFRRPVTRTPVWIMRQAGRYLPEYRALRERHDFLTCCRTPELACEITLQPVRRLGVDAAILFSDILLPLPGMGVEVAFEPAPRLARAVRSAADVDALRVADARETQPFVQEAVRLLRCELKVPLIGFAGAPFTVASYLIEGGGSRTFSATKQLLFSEPALAHWLLVKCADTVASSLVEQVRAGAQAAMLFDTWSGVLAPEEYREFALPYARRVLEAVGRARAVPRIYYAGESAGHLEVCAGVGAEVIGLDWRQDIGEARRRLGPALAVQGNLDPAELLGPPDRIRRRVAEILGGARGPDGRALGHVFNLGHGVLPDTKPEHAQLLVDAVHELSAGRP